MQFFRKKSLLQNFVNKIKKQNLQRLYEECTQYINYSNKRITLKSKIEPSK